MPSAIRQIQIQNRWLLRLAEQRLGTSCAVFDLDWSLTWELQKASARPQTLGFDQHPALRMWLAGSEGHSLTFGFSQYRVRLPDRTIPVLCANYPCKSGACSRTVSLWFCPTTELRRLYRFLRRAADEEQSAGSPLMLEAERQRLWDNTVGFLMRGRKIWEEFQIPLRRGVMLVGEPGNGKTMAARWLRTQAAAHDLEWAVVTGEQYDKARNEGTLSELLSLDEPGLVFLDDFDRGLEDRQQQGPTRDHSALLSALDGMETRQGVVYVFTSNLKPAELDPAIRRPGRIDTFIPFPRPTADLRCRFIQEFWPPAIRQAVPIPEAVAATEGLSFAEIDEIKKLMVMGYLETEVWNWSEAFAQFQQRTAVAPVREPIGFATIAREPGTMPIAAPATKLSIESSENHRGD